MISKNRDKPPSSGTNNRKTILRFTLIVIILVALSYFLGVHYNSNNGSENDVNSDTTTSDYSWDTDPNRLALLEEVKNITLIVEYGNGTIDKFININLSDHYTSVFDALRSKCQVKYDIYYFGTGRALFYVTEINGLHENVQENHFWLYYVNGEYALVACNAYQLHDNDIIRWVYSSPIS